MAPWDYRGGATPRSEISRMGAQQSQHVALVWVWRPENQDSQWHEMRWPAGLRIKKGPCFILSPKVGKDWCSSSKQPRGTQRISSCSACCSVQVFSWLGEAHTHWGGSSALFGLHIQQFISPRNTHINTPKECLTQWFSTLWPRQSGTKNSPSLMQLSFQVSNDMLLPPGFLAGPSQDDVKGSCYVPHSILFIPCPDTWVPPPLA